MSASKRTSSGERKLPVFPVWQAPTLFFIFQGKRVCYCAIMHLPPAMYFFKNPTAWGKRNSSNTQKIALETTAVGGYRSPSKCTSFPPPMMKGNSRSLIHTTLGGSVVFPPPPPVLYLQGKYEGAGQGGLEHSVVRKGQKEVLPFCCQHRGKAPCGTTLDGKVLLFCICKDFLDACFKNKIAGLQSLTGMRCPAVGSVLRLSMISHG